MFTFHRHIIPYPIYEYDIYIWANARTCTLEKPTVSRVGFDYH